MSIESLIQIAASLLILVPFVLVQLRRMRTDTSAYAALNLVGSTVLAIDALHGHQWGFLLLEGTWAVVSAYAPRPAVSGRGRTSSDPGRTRRATRVGQDRVMERRSIDLPAGTIHYRRGRPGRRAAGGVRARLPRRRHPVVRRTGAAGRRGVPHVRADLAAGVAHRPR